MSWNPYVKKAQSLGFERVCIVDRGDGRAIGTTDPRADVPTKWRDGSRMVNENQELLERWDGKREFSFFGKKFNVVLRDDEDGKWLSGSVGDEVVVAREYKSIWFVAGGRGFSGAPDAFHTLKSIWDSLDEAGV